jgi:hypothetical protein
MHVNGGVALFFAASKILGMDGLIERIREIELVIKATNRWNWRYGNYRAMSIEALVAEMGSVKAAAAALGISRQAAQKAIQRARALSAEERAAYLQYICWSNDRRGDTP